MIAKFLCAFTVARPSRVTNLPPYKRHRAEFEVPKKIKNSSAAYVEIFRKAMAVVDLTTRDDGPIRFLIKAQVVTMSTLLDDDSIDPENLSEFVDPSSLGLTGLIG